jgi:CO/xanthine dehydrogenase Mo-binding subunit
MADLAGVNGTRNNFRVVGKPNLPGVLSWSQATGIAKFGIDYIVPGMLEAKFLRSPHANACIKSINIAKAKSIPGVVDSPGKTKTSGACAKAAGSWRTTPGFSGQSRPDRKGRSRRHRRGGKCRYL